MWGPLASKHMYFLLHMYPYTWVGRINIDPGQALQGKANRFSLKFTCVVGTAHSPASPRFLIYLFVLSLCSSPVLPFFLFFLTSCTEVVHFSVKVRSRLLATMPLQSCGAVYQIGARGTIVLHQYTKTSRSDAVVQYCGVECG